GIGARMHGLALWKTEETIVGLPRLLVLPVFSRFGGCHEWHSVKPNTLGLKVLRTQTPARRQMINNMISISLDGKPCVSEVYSVLFIYNSINLILVRVERKSLIRKTLILIRVPFVSARSFPRRTNRPTWRSRGGMPSTISLAAPQAWFLPGIL